MFSIRLGVVKFTRLWIILRKRWKPTGYKPLSIRLECTREQKAEMLSFNRGIEWISLKLTSTCILLCDWKPERLVQYLSQCSEVYYWVLHLMLSLRWCHEIQKLASLEAPLKFGRTTTLWTLYRLNENMVYLSKLSALGQAEAWFPFYSSTLTNRELLARAVSTYSVTVGRCKILCQTIDYSNLPFKIFMRLDLHIYRLIMSMGLFRYDGYQWITSANLNTWAKLFWRIFWRVVSSIVPVGLSTPPSKQILHGSLLS